MPPLQSMMERSHPSPSWTAARNESLTRLADFFVVTMQAVREDDPLRTSTPKRRFPVITGPATRILVPGAMSRVSNRRMSTSSGPMSSGSTSRSGNSHSVTPRSGL
ncbi:hypothetical protein ACFQH8_07930 [Halomicroarcula sp. GCM10025710]